MRFKKPKEDVLNELMWTAKATISNHLYNNPDLSRENLSMTIALGIKSAFETLLTNEYTDDDFERDIQLK